MKSDLSTKARQAHAMGPSPLSAGVMVAEQSV